jgi:hypothetical protein
MSAAQKELSTREIRRRHNGRGLEEFGAEDAQSMLGDGWVTCSLCSRADACRRQRHGRWSRACGHCRRCFGERWPSVRTDRTDPVTGRRTCTVDVAAEQLERELASLRRDAARREHEEHKSPQRKDLGAEATKRGAEEFKSLREAPDSAGARLLAAHTVAFERARANAAEASARQAVDAAVKLKRERDDAWEALRACNLQLAETENALKRRHDARRWAGKFRA